MKTTKISLLALAALAFTSCDDFFEPAKENNLGVDYMYNNASYAEGVLGNAYTRIPCGSFPFSEVATDDAVSNDADNSWRKMAAGSWTADNNPTETWRNCNSAIMYINLFLSRADRVEWANDSIAKHLYCDRALALLPTRYTDIATDADVPANYRSTGATASQYNRVFGAKFNGRMDGAIVEAFRAKALLLAASPAYNGASGVTYQQAADAAATVLGRIGGVSGMDPKGWTWYCNNSEIDGLANGANPAEILWRGEKSQNNDWETDNYPPSLYGKGRINPTQNFVDAFPMANGYPIADKASGYNSNDPYTARDPRLAAYVVYNGSKVGVNDKEIITAADGETRDALNNVTGSSTRTGYYLRKLLRQDINLDPTVNSKQYHYTPRLRYTELFLDYAEAANEAYGPTGKGSHGYSAYDVIKAIRSRAGVGADNGDAYLESIKDNKELMRNLIRNERRIELSFEGFRFWDLRRWLSPLTDTARGIEISTANKTMKTIDVEARQFSDYQCYGPIPYSEVLKFSNLKQNKGW